MLKLLFVLAVSTCSAQAAKSPRQRGFAADVVDLVNAAEARRGVPASTGGEFHDVPALLEVCSEFLNTNALKKDVIDGAFLEARDAVANMATPRHYVFGCRLGRGPSGGWIGKYFYDDGGVENTIGSVDLFGRGKRASNGSWTKGAIPPGEYLKDQQSAFDPAGRAGAIDYSSCASCSRLVKSYWDEVREVTPGVFIGKMWRRRGRKRQPKKFVQNFALFQLSEGKITGV